MSARTRPIRRQFIALAMAFVMFAASGPLSVVHAARVATDDVIEEISAAENRAGVLEFLAREDVRRELEALGVDPDEAMRRARSLSDKEIQKIAGQLDALPAGQDAFSAIVGAALLIFLVLLITDILGLTHLFPFVNH